MSLPLCRRSVNLGALAAGPTSPQTHNSTPLPFGNEPTNMCSSDYDNNALQRVAKIAVNLLATTHTAIPLIRLMRKHVFCLWLTATAPSDLPLERGDMHSRGMGSRAMAELLRSKVAAIGGHYIGSSDVVLQEVSVLCKVQPLAPRTLGLMRGSAPQWPVRGACRSATSYLAPSNKRANRETTLPQASPRFWAHSAALAAQGTTTPPQRQKGRSVSLRFC